MFSVDTFMNITPDTIVLLSIPERRNKWEHSWSLITLMDDIDYYCLSPVVEDITKRREPLPSMEAIYLITPSDEVNDPPVLAVYSSLVQYTHSLTIVSLAFFIYIYSYFSVIWIYNSSLCGGISVCTIQGDVALASKTGLTVTLVVTIAASMWTYLLCVSTFDI